MFGRHWEPAQAKIVAKRIKSTTSDGMVSIDEFVADVTLASGVVFRTLLEEPTIATNFWPPRVGMVVMVHADAKRRKAKFDKDDPQIDARRQMNAADTSFNDVLNSPPGS